MRRGREIMRLPVIARTRGRRLGIVKDLVIDLDRWSVAALLVSERVGPEPEAILPFSAIRRVGPDAVMVEDGLERAEGPECERLRALAESPVDLVGMKVFTDQGRLLGTVSDILWDERTGAVEQCEVAGGPFRDLVSGRVWVPAGPPTSVGDQFMVVPEEAVSPRRAVLEMGPPLVVEGRPWEGPVPAVRDVDHVSAELVIQQEELLVGMRAEKTVSDEEPGGVIVFEGETITEEIVERAKAAGKLNLLVQAAGEAVALALAGGPEGQYARVGAGRLAARTVRTTEGEVIVAQGDVVTPEVVQMAQDAGVMDQLVEAVRTPAEERFGRAAARRRAARSLWDQLSERVGWLMGARRGPRRG